VNKPYLAKKGIENSTTLPSTLAIRAANEIKRIKLDEISEEFCIEFPQYNLEFKIYQVFHE
jgi:hypothetical protein